MKYLPFKLKAKITFLLMIITVTFLSLLPLYFLTHNTACASTQPVLKEVALSILKFQEKYHKNTHSFFDSNSEEMKAISLYWENHIKTYFSPPISYSLLVKNYGKYATVNILPNKHEKYDLRSYTGAIARNISEEKYSVILCSKITDIPLPELYPLSDIGKQLEFKCPQKTIEDC